MIPFSCPVEWCPSLAEVVCGVHICARNEGPQNFVVPAACCPPSNLLAAVVYVNGDSAWDQEVGNLQLSIGRYEMQRTLLVVCGPNLGYGDNPLKRPQHDVGCNEPEVRPHSLWDPCLRRRQLEVGDGRSLFVPQSCKIQQS